MNIKILFFAFFCMLFTNVARAQNDIQVHYRNIAVQGVNIFYREAGKPSAPTVVLLHGFGTSSYMFRNVIPQLAGKYHVIAPDLPGFGQSNVLPNQQFKYTFDNFSSVIDAFIAAKGVDKFALYVFDYGAPVGWRIAVQHPKRVTAIISQNGNAYEEGLSPGWTDIRKTWASPTPENRETLRKFNSLDMIRWQYTEGVKDPSLIAPESYQLAATAIDRHGIDAQMDLLLNYGQNLEQYKELHKYFRSYKPPILAIWGKNDPFFLPEGANAFKRDNANAEIKFLDTGHFAIETHSDEIGKEVLSFLDRHIKK